MARDNWGNLLFSDIHAGYRCICKVVRHDYFQNVRDLCAYFENWSAWPCVVRKPRVAPMQNKAVFPIYSEYTP
jgi:hypothetical protein